MDDPVDPFVFLAALEMKVAQQDKLEPPKPVVIPPPAFEGATS